MKAIRSTVLSLALFSVVLASCSGMQKDGHMDWKTMVDADKAAQAPAVLRVKLIRSEGSDKYGWDIVGLIGEIKNETGFTFPREFHVAHYSAEPGVPKGESTIYLERYSEAEPPQWKLLHGSGKDGVSHNVN
jgi:ABC-type phosphate/phosphonate transport system substrate-binding protein